MRARQDRASRVLSCLDNRKQSLTQRLAIREFAVAGFALPVLGGDCIVAANDELTPHFGGPARRDSLTLEGSSRQNRRVDGHRRYDGGDVLGHAIDVYAALRKVFG